jgi:hypothetical protein
VIGWDAMELAAWREQDDRARPGEE